MDRFVLGLGERLRRSLRNDAGGEIHAGVVPGRGRLQDLVQAAVEYEIYDEPSDCITHYWPVTEFYRVFSFDGSSSATRAGFSPTFLGFFCPLSSIKD